MLPNKLQIAEVHREGEFGEVQLAGSGGICESPAITISFSNTKILVDLKVYHIWDKELPSNFDLISRSLDLSPDSVCPSPTADLNKVSNFTWSCAVINDSLIFGIFAPLDFDARRPLAGAAEGVDLKLSAIAAKPVG